MAFDRGAMTEIGLQNITSLATLGFLSLPAQGVSSILLAVFNAKGDTKPPLVISLIGLVCIVPFSLLGMHYFALRGVLMALVGCYWMIMLLQLSILLLGRRQGKLVMGWLNTRL